MTPHHQTLRPDTSDDLRQRATKETANAIARMKNGAALVDGSDLDSAIRHIAAATRKPVDLPRLPTMGVTQADGSVRTIPMPATWHNPRRREHYEGVDVARWVDLGNTPKSKPSLLRRVLNWFGR